MDIKVNSDTPQFITWLAGVAKISQDHHAEHYSAIPRPEFLVDWGNRYVRVWRTQGGSSKSAHAFLDRTNGDVLKPDSWKRPAKHARGNIFDDKNGLGSMGEYGPAYLR